MVLQLQQQQMEGKVSVHVVSGVLCMVAIVACHCRWYWHPAYITLIHQQSLSSGYYRGIFVRVTLMHAGRQLTHSAVTPWKPLSTPNPTHHM